MNGNDRFGIREAVALVTVTISAKVFYSSPATVTELIGTASWYMTLISAIVASLGFWLIYLLLNRFPGKDLVEIFNLVLGQFWGFVFSNIVALYVFMIAIIRLSEFSEVIKVYAFPLSSNWYIVGLSIIVVYILSRLGIENIARVASVLVFPLLFGYLVVLILGSQNYYMANLYPLLGHGLKKTVVTGVVRSSVYGEVIVFAIFAKSFQGLKYIKKEGFLSLVFSALLISGSVLFFNLSFPYFIGREITAPMYEMASLIDYGESLQRVESIFLFIWVISSLISTATMFYSFIWILCKTFKIQDQNPIVLGGCLLLYAASLMHRDMTSVVAGGVELIRKYGSVIFFILPSLVLVIAAVFKKGVRSNV